MSSGSNPEDVSDRDLPDAHYGLEPTAADDPLPSERGVKPKDPEPTVMDLLQQILQRLERIEKQLGISHPEQRGAFDYDTPPRRTSTEQRTVRPLRDERET